MRGTKADWRVTTLLEGYLKAHPSRIKSDEEKAELSRHYVPNEDVLPRVEVAPEEHDSEDDRLMAQVRELSMANVDPEAARRRDERNERRRIRADRARRGLDSGGQQLPQIRQDGAHRTPLSEARLREHDAATDDHHVEHQPSLRSLLSASPFESHHVEQEILQSIYADGLLEGIDIDHLTPQQEEELTERIADAYRRRQRRRDRSGNREHGQHSSQTVQPAPAAVGVPDRLAPRQDTTPAQQTQSRSRPPVSRPHLFEQSARDVPRSHGRSTSATSQRSNLSVGRSEGTPAAPASRSATDLSERPRTEEAERERRRRLSSNTTRSTTDPDSRVTRDQIHRMRATSAARDDASIGAERRPVHPLDAMRRPSGQANNSTPSLPTPGALAVEHHTVRPVVSKAAFAPEPVHEAPTPPTAVVLPPVAAVSHTPAISCQRCGKPDIQHSLHYHCPWCRNGTFDICQSCYREGQCCDHWYGFGYIAYERWIRSAPPEGHPPGFERPHVLSARRFVKPVDEPPALATAHGTLAKTEDKQEEGAFCESCSAFANDCYWHCQYCLEGAWGFCDRCVQQGKHCTHPLLPVGHISTMSQQDPTKTAFIQLPHLRQDSYVVISESTLCDICERAILPNSSRYHCSQCSNGNYDVCTDCYRGLIAAGKISHANGTSGWRRCLQGHRMTIVGNQAIPEGGQQRYIVAERVGGLRLEDSNTQQAAPPANDNTGQRCLALWSYFPKEEVVDELAFPKNAEIREVQDMNSDWYVGVYAGKVGLYPSNHVRRL